METKTKILNIQNGKTMKGREIFAIQQIFKNFSFIATDDQWNELRIQVEYESPKEDNEMETACLLAISAIELGGKVVSTWDRVGPIEDPENEKAVDCCSTPEVVARG